MITIVEITGGYQYDCECGWRATHPLKARVNCPRCKRHKLEHFESLDNGAREASSRQSARARYKAEHRERRISDKQRLAQPCVFLGEPTGKTHKVGCGDRYLDEHFCRCAQREVVEIQSRRQTQTKVLTPKAVPRGRCRDLEIYRGAVATCVDCPLYRAGLLRAPPAE